MHLHYQVEKCDSHSLGPFLTSTGHLYMHLSNGVSHCLHPARFFCCHHHPGVPSVKCPSFTKVEIGGWDTFRGCKSSETETTKPFKPHDLVQEIW